MKNDTESIEWKIIPYKSVRPLMFGMSHAEVEAILGKPESVKSDLPVSASKELRERYSGYVVEHRIGKGIEALKRLMQYKEGKVVSVEMYDSEKSLEINVFRPFESSKVAANEKLKSMSNHYAEDGDSLIFLDFGIAIDAFDTWGDISSINVFAKGQFDDIIERGIASSEIKIIKK
jgi:hypothetical protein